MRHKGESSFVEQIMNKCRYFNGIQHERCEKGIKYQDVRDTTVRPYRWPCFGFPAATTVCEFVSFHTREEAEQKEREWDNHIKAVLLQLANGECPLCRKPVQRKQVGPCVYGDCGHRLYQGRLKEETQ